jgi:hypothetical protein
LTVNHVGKKINLGAGSKKPLKTIKEKRLPSDLGSEFRRY